MKRSGSTGSGNASNNSVTINNTGPSVASPAVSVPSDVKVIKDIQPPHQQPQQNNISSLQNDNSIDEQSLVNNLQQLSLNNETVSIDNEQNVK